MHHASGGSTPAAAVDAVDAVAIAMLGSRVHGRESYLTDKDQRAILDGAY